MWYALLRHESCKHNFTTIAEWHVTLCSEHLPLLHACKSASFDVNPGRQVSVIPVLITRDITVAAMYRRESSHLELAEAAWWQLNPGKATAAEVQLLQRRTAGLQQ